MTRRDNPARGHRGKYARDPNTAEQDAAACQLRADGHTYRAIAAELHITVSSAHDAVQRALRAIVEEPATEVLRLELDRLDAELVRLNGLEAAARAVLEREHVTVSHGKVITMEDPDTGDEKPLLDDGPVLQAIDRLVRIEDARRRNGERRAKLLGLEAAVKVDATVTEVTQEDIELAELIREAKAKNAAEEERIKGVNGDESG